MPKKTIIFISILIGSTISRACELSLFGCSIPFLWGTTDLMSPTISFFGMIGGVAGLILGVGIINFFEADDQKD